ncbi:Gldg family protein [Acidihalobacter prosperus]
MAGPTKNFTRGESRVITKYVKNGGSLLWMHDPGSLHGLKPLAKSLHLSFIPGTVVDANPELRTMIGIHNPAVVPILNYGNSKITSHLKIQTLMPFSAAIEQPAGGGAWLAKPLLRTLPKSWSETGPLKGHVQYNAASGDTLGPLVLGESFSRKLSGNHQQRIAVFGSSDFASNAFIGLGANLNLMTATFNWLSHNDNLIHIDLPSAPDTKLALSRAGGYTIGAFFLILLPLSLLLSGTLIWYRRRRTTS